jgi:hypothetical protein
MPGSFTAAAHYKLLGRLAAQSSIAASSPKIRLVARFRGE